MTETICDYPGFKCKGCKACKLKLPQREEETVPKVWIDPQSGTFGTNVDDLTIVEMTDSEIEVFESLSDSQRAAIADEMKYNACTFNEAEEKVWSKRRTFS